MPKGKNNPFVTIHQFVLGDYLETKEERGKKIEYLQIPNGCFAVVFNSKEKLVEIFWDQLRLGPLGRKSDPNFLVLRPKDEKLVEAVELLRLSVSRPGKEGEKRRKLISEFLIKFWEFQIYPGRYTGLISRG